MFLVTLASKANHPEHHWGVDTRTLVHVQVRWVFGMEHVRGNVHDRFHAQGMQYSLWFDDVFLPTALLRGCHYIKGTVR